MRFTQSVLAALSIAASEAVILTNSAFTGIEAGSPFQITYAEAVGAVTVFQATGTPDNVIRGAAIGSSSGASGSIPWTPASGGNFALVIVDAGAPEGPTNPNYSPFFSVSGSEIETTTTGAPASTTTAAGSSSTTHHTTTHVLTTTMAPQNTTMTTSSSIRANNSTMTSSTTRSSGSSSTSGSDSTSVPTQVPDSMASGFASPLAFVFLAVGALLTLN